MSDALARAQPGDTVHVGECEIVGTFSVPAGVAVLGSGPDLSRIIGEGGPAFATRGGTPETRLEALSVEARGGVGIGAEGGERLVLRNIYVLGPGSCVPVDGSSSEESCGYQGIAVLNVDEAVFEDIRTRGAYGFGVLSVGSILRWNGGGSSEGIGTGLHVDGGEAELSNLRLQGNMADDQNPGYGAVFADNATVTTSDLWVEDNEGFGVVHESVIATHDSLTLRGNAGGLLAQAGTTINVQDVDVQDNTTEGLLFNACSAIRVGGARVDRTAQGSTAQADGLLVAGGFGSMRLSGCTFVDNGRVGVLVDLSGESFENAQLENITVDGTGSQYGFVVQNGAVSEGWDQQVTRLGATVANDAARTMPLPLF